MGALDDALESFAGTTGETLNESKSAPSFSIDSTPKQDPLTDALSSWADQDESNALNDAAALGIKKDSAKSTKVLQLFGKTGLPRDFIERNQAFVEQESAKQGFDADTLMKESPAFASWLSEHPDHVAAAMPDLSKIGYLEKQWRYMGSSREAGRLMDELVDIGGKSFNETITLQERTRQAEIEKQLEAIGRSNEGLDLDIISQVPGAMLEQFPNLVRGLKGKVEFGAKGLVAGTAAGAVVGSAAGPGGTATGAIGGGLVGGSTGWRYGAAVNAGEVERNAALLDYEKLKDDQGQPLDRSTIKGLALMAGAINGAVEGMTGLEAMIDKLPGVKQLTRKGIKELLKTPTARAAILEIAKNMGNVAVTEGATEAFQMYVTKAGGELAKWAKDGGGPVDVLSRIFSSENFAQAKQEALRGAQAGGGTATVLSVPGVVQDFRQAKQAQQNKQLFEAMGKAAESADFAKQLPDQLREIVERATKDGPVESVYAPSDTWNTYFQSQGVDPRAVYEEVTGNVEAYDQALQTGQPLPIKTADYAAKLAGTEHNAFLAGELKTDLSQMNAREADEWMAMMDAQPQEGVQAATVADPTAKITQDISGQLQAAGLTPEVAQHYADLYAETFATRAQRRELGEDPAELFAKLNVQVSKQIPEILKTVGKQQTELNALLDRLRNNEFPKAEEIYGQSLTEFLKTKGGVQDQGGELSARGVDANRKAFQKKLSQAKGLTLDQAAEAAQEAGYLNQRDLGALLDAIDQEARGKPVYAIGKENARLLDVQTNLDSLKAFLDARGVDLNATPNDRIAAMLGESIQQTLPDEDGQTFAQPVYHGTPHAWKPEPGFPHGRPRLDKIGTGEGAQAYGWGWYSAEAQEVAESYKDALASTRILIDGKRHITINPQTFYGLKGIVKKLGLSAEESTDAESLIRSFVRFRDWGAVQASVDEMSDYFRPRNQAVLDKIRPRITTESNGSLYTLDIPDSVLPKLLDWDKPLSQQSKLLQALQPLIAQARKSFPSLDLNKMTGGDFYNAYTSHRGGNQKTASEALRDVGIPGLKYLDNVSRNNDDWKMIPANETVSGKWVVSQFGGANASKFDTEAEAKAFLDKQLAGLTSNYVIWDQPTLDKIALLERNGKKLDAIRELYQGDGTPKGSITFGEHSVSIKLLEKADLSTFIHESGHLYLNSLVEDATTEGTPQQLRDDLDTILKWMGLEVRAPDGKAAILAAIQTVHHEQFARGFESYAMEGKSPSVALREAFARFRAWMIQVYKSLTTGPLQVKLTKEVRAVMDRMVATDEAIAAAAEEADVLPMFTDAESAGMTPTQFAAYEDLVRNASLTAREQLEAKLMAQAKREQATWWKDKRDEMVQTITKEVNEEPEYIALSVLKTGKMPDGSEIPHGIAAMKLDKKGLVDTFGADFVKRLPKGITAKDGMHHDAAAQLFGFSNGQDFVLALANARDKAQLIQAETDRRMQETYGDIRFDGTLAEEARAAVLNDQQAKVIEAELKAIQAKQREVAPFVKAAQAEAKANQKAGRDLLSTMIPTLKATRTLARNIISRMAIKAIKANDYSIAARQASRKATAATAKQDWVTAGHFKQQELLNLALYREAGIVKEQLESARELAKGFFREDATLAKTRNVDLVNVGRAILAQYGFGTAQPKSAAEYLDQIQKYDQDLYNQWKPQVDALAPRPLDYRALTVQEFTKLTEDLKALWLLSRRTQQAKIDGQLMDRADMIDLLTAELAAKTTTEQSRILGEQSKWDDAKMGLLSWTSALRRVESWVDVMDGGNINGLFRRFLWNPIQDAAVSFRTEKATLLKKYLDLIKPIETTMTRDLIPAPELGEGYAFRGRSALLHAILHTGNESNQTKLLNGYHWDASQWDAFVRRAQADGTLTKADYDYAQGVWDLLESIKPQAQQAHHEMYGYYFNEITAKPIDTPWGQYKGGYVPAIADRVRSVDQAIREEKDLFDQAGNSFMFPTTGRGFTKSRVETYAAPLALNLATIPIHLDKVMRFVHLEPRIKDIARLVTNKQLRTALDAMNPTVAKDMLVPWLQRSAQQTVSTPGKNRHADKLFRYLRGTVGAQIMVGNVVNTLQQFTGFSLSLTKVKGRYLRGALVNYLKGPGTLAEAIHQKSPYMAQRTTTQVMDIQQNIDEILLNPTKYEKAKDFAQRHGYFMQQGTQNIVDLITWSGAYDQSIQDGAGEQEAVREADAAVRQTQGSFDPESLSNFEAGTPFVRAFTMFYSYFNMQANLLGSEFQKVAESMGVRKGAGKAFYLYFIGFLIPAVLAETIVSGLGGFEPDDEDGYLNETLSVLFGSQLRSALAFFPGVGPVAMAGINAFNKKWYDDRIATSPVVSTLESAARAPHSLYQAMSEDGHSKRAVRDVLTLLGLVTGTPAGTLNKPLGYLADVYDGVATPENALDVGRGLVTGKDVNRKK